MGYSILAAMARNYIGIQIDGHFIQFQLGKPKPVNDREQLVVTLLIELPEEPAESALAVHPFIPAEYAPDDLIMSQGTGVGESGGSQNGADHKPISKIKGNVPSIGAGSR